MCEACAFIHVQMQQTGYIKCVRCVVCQFYLNEDMKEIREEREEDSEVEEKEKMEMDLDRDVLPDPCWV